MDMNETPGGISTPLGGITTPYIGLPPRPKFTDKDWFQAIDQFCRASPDLANYKRPRNIIFVDSLPTNPSGKVLKRELISAFEKPAAA